MLRLLPAEVHNSPPSGTVVSDVMGTALGLLCGLPFLVLNLLGKRRNLTGLSCARCGCHSWAVPLGWAGLLDKQVFLQVPYLTSAPAMHRAQNSPPPLPPFGALSALPSWGRAGLR